MDFRDKDGEPLIKWHDPESAFEAWKKCTAGRPCDYTGLSYDKLRGGSGVQWPCNDEHPNGTERLYTDAVFNTQADNAETYGKDLKTGGAIEAEAFKAMAPEGRAILRTEHYRPSPEVPSDEFPLLLTTGRTVYHFHTRTKTGSAPELQAAAPDVWVELSTDDAKTYGIAEGDTVKVSSPRGSLFARCRISGIRNGVLFVPFHYGYWDIDELGRPTEGGRAANELTITSWDPVSNQPLFKAGAVKVEKVADADGPSPAPNIGGSKIGGAVLMQLNHYLALLERSEAELATAYAENIESHADEVDFYYVAQAVRDECLSHSGQLKPFLEKYGHDDEDEPDRLHTDLFSGTRTGPLGFLRDLHDLYLMVCECDITWTLVGQAAKGLRDEDLLSVVENCEGEIATQMKWLKSRLKQAAPQVLVVG